MFVREETPGASHPDLHFVENQQHLIAIAKFAEPLQIVRPRHHDAAFALNRLDHHRDGFVMPGSLERRHVVEGN